MLLVLRIYYKFNLYHKIFYIHLFSHIQSYYNIINFPYNRTKLLSGAVACGPTYSFFFCTLVYDQKYKVVIDFPFQVEILRLTTICLSTVSWGTRSLLSRISRGRRWGADNSMGEWVALSDGRHGRRTHPPSVSP